MELKLDGHPSFNVEGEVTVELPAYMELLQLDELTEARASDDRENLILAAGRHPGSGDIVFLTGVGELREIKMKMFHIPPGHLFPADFGQTIRIEPKEFEAFEIASDWAFENSELILNLGSIAASNGASVSRVAYLDE